MCREILLLCDCIRRDFMYRMTPLHELLLQSVESQHLTHLDFLLQYGEGDFVHTALPQEANGELNSFLASLGKSDLPTQMDLLSSFQNYMEKEEAHLKSHHARYAALQLAFGVFSGAIIVLFLI